MKTYTHALKTLAWAAIALGAATQAIATDAAPAAGTATGTPSLRSTQPHGTITLAPDTALAGGRLLIRVVAFNPGTEPATLESAAIDVRTGAGAGVRLMSLDKLVEEARAAGRPQSTGSGYQQSAYAHNDNMAMRDSSGNIVAGNYGGAAAPNAIDQATLAARGGKDDPALTQQLDALRAGILQTLSVPPGKAAGAQVVTERMHFGRKDPRTLVVLVHFNGDEHRIEVPVPAEGGH